jgi:hypothetical protein
VLDRLRGKILFADTKDNVCMSNIKIANLDPGDDSFRDLQQNEIARIYGGFGEGTIYLADGYLFFLDMDWMNGPIIFNDGGETPDGELYSTTSVFVSKRSDD